MTRENNYLLPCYEVEVKSIMLYANIQYLHFKYTSNKETIP
jgi:hypothetical protein